MKTAEYSIDILFIEEDAYERKIFIDFFSGLSEPFQITTALSLKHAKNLMKRRNFEIVIAEINFIDGHIFDVMKQNAGIPFVIITARGYEELAVLALKSGAVEYLVKDVEKVYLKRLPAIINKILQNKRLEQIKKIISFGFREIEKGIAILDREGYLLFANPVFLDHSNIKGTYFRHTIQSLLSNRAKVLADKLSEIIRSEPISNLTFSISPTEGADTIDFTIAPAIVGEGPDDRIGYILLGY